MCLPLAAREETRIPSHLGAPEAFERRLLERERDGRTATARRLLPFAVTSLEVKCSLAPSLPPLQPPERDFDYKCVFASESDFPPAADETDPKLLVQLLQRRQTGENQDEMDDGRLSPSRCSLGSRSETRGKKKRDR